MLDLTSSSRRRTALILSPEMSTDLSVQSRLSSTIVSDNRSPSEMNKSRHHNRCLRRTFFGDPKVQSSPNDKEKAVDWSMLTGTKLFEKNFEIFPENNSIVAKGVRGQKENSEMFQLQEQLVIRDRAGKAVGSNAPEKFASIQRKKPEQLKLPTPIMVMGMMKAGTTSIYSYFKCGMDPNTTKLSHYDCRPGKLTDTINMPCGKRLDSNIEGGREAFEEIDHYHLYAELDANTNNGIILPQYKYLQQIYEVYPNATWILNLRDPQDWLKSIDRWQNLRQRFIWSNQKPDLPSQGRSKSGERPTGEKDEDMINFYNKQAQRVKDFVSNHPSLHFVEVQIDQKDAGEIMERAFGISQHCWGNKNINKGDAKWSAI
ncbi:hypothetical protein IV203_022279 [Nitzschia inconspicua]|uniref:P-loop containing nucleoside triphosphate hydrolase protein n=1 Tax=Nitzschia inconspicua TaxID=303405 RepID=A0A9K3KIZ1_9STRA|nr:hypothetical protein IV203_022279 [Nitzschia inconspicua]